MTKKLSQNFKKPIKIGKLSKYENNKWHLKKKKKKNTSLKQQ